MATFGSMAGALASRALGALLAVALWLGAGAALAQDALGGQYDGLDNAEGWSISLTPATDGFEGVFTDRAGRQTEFWAPGNAQEASGKLEIAGAPVLFQFSPRAIGMVLFWIPIAADGALEVESAKPFAFLRKGERLPDAPEIVREPPQKIGERVDPFVFLENYEFWTGQEVGRGYVGLLERHRTLIRLYAHVHTDVLWKLCQSPTSPAGLAEALEGQNVACGDLLTKVEELQRTGRFSAYKQGLSEERAKLIDAIRCAQGALSQETCVKVSRWTAQAAISLETAQTILSRY